jgi:hypothetical protein
MSKFHDQIHSTYQRRSAPLGFTSHSQANDEQSFVLVLAEVSDASAASTAVAAGVDALLYNNGQDDIPAIIEAAGEIPVGTRLAAATNDDTKSMINEGIDFLVFDVEHTEATALLSEELGYVAILTNNDATDDDLRLLQPLELDALLISGSKDVLSVQDQLLTRRIAELTHKPLIVPVTTDISIDTLQVLRDAGAPIVLTSNADSTALERLVANTRDVPSPRESHEERPNPLLPIIPPPVLEEAEE